jgi:D-glycero-D-manno-heptose 1,7-bisphosphate phosphatase
MGKNRALILDRDGVINVDHGYVYRPEDCEFVEGVFDMVRAFTERGFLIVIATNQAGIGRGLYTEEDFQSFMTWMRGEFRKQGIEIAAVYHCPDHPTAGIGPYRRDNPWRKPGPGMILQAAEDLDLELKESWCVGDKMSDIEAAAAAGVGTRIMFGPLCLVKNDAQAFSRSDSLTAIGHLLTDQNLLPF